MWTGRTDVLQGSGEASYHVSKITLRFVERGISGKGNRYYSGKFRAKLTSMLVSNTSGLKASIRYWKLSYSDLQLDLNGPSLHLSEMKSPGQSPMSAFDWKVQQELSRKRTIIGPGTIPENRRTAQQPLVPVDHVMYLSLTSEI